jgi:hypothetical protein
MPGARSHPSSGTKTGTEARNRPDVWDADSTEPDDIDSAEKERPKGGSEKMQARLEIRRFPVTLVLIAFGLAAALLVGLQLGYALRAAPALGTPTGKVIVVTTQPLPSQDPCVFVNRVKEC